MIGVSDIVRNYVNTRTKIVSNDDYHNWVAYTFIIFDLAFELQGQIQGQRPLYRISSRNDVSTYMKVVSNDS